MSYNRESDTVSRLQQTFDFHVIKTDHFDVYFYPEEEEATQRVSRVSTLKEELAPYNVHKSTIRPFSRPVPARLIARIAKFRRKLWKAKNQDARIRGCSSTISHEVASQISRLSPDCPASLQNR
jgi:hypothetical protein